MAEKHDIRKLGGDKIALLVLFALSLLAARFVVALKSKIAFSAPIPLPRTGLSVSVPTGKGWRGQGRWVRQGNAFILGSSFSPGSGKSTAEVICRYRATTGMIAPKLQFDQKAREHDGKIVETDRMDTDSLTFDWARIQGRNIPLTMFLATTVLPDDRQLDIEVYEYTGDADWAEQAFRGVVERVSLQDSRLRTAALVGTGEEKGSL